MSGYRKSVSDRVQVLADAATHYNTIPEAFYRPSEDIYNNLKDVLKVAFDANVRANPKASSLAQLYVEGFDTEQIWEEINLENQSFIPQLEKRLNKLLKNQKRLGFAGKNRSGEAPSSSSQQQGVAVNQDTGEETYEQESITSDDTETEQLSQSKQELGREEEDETGGTSSSQPKHEPSEVDDEFFSLHQMEDFVRQQEELYEKERDNESKDLEQEEEVDEPEYDLFAPNAGLKDEDIGSENEDNFFKPPASSGTQTYDEDKYKNDEAEQEDDEENEDDETSGDESEYEADEQYNTNVQNMSASNQDSGTGSHKTPLNEQLEQRRQEISQLEEEVMGEKHWSLKGEATSNQRPENSLLEATVEYDQVSKPAPIVTSEKTSSLEETIKQRIKDEAYDDVERKLAPTEAKQLEAKAEEQSQQTNLSDEKSKAGLGEVYESEYLQRAMGASSENEKKQERLEEEVKTLFDDLRQQLDSLTNFHYTPKPSVKELDVETKPNVPALSMEEVVPMAVSESEQKAPEEVHKPLTGKGGSLRSKTEMNPQEKTASRRSLKAQKRKRKRQREHEQKLLAETQPDVAAKQDTERVTKELRASNKVIQGTQSEGGPSSYTKSNQFFNDLQASVRNQLKDGSSAPAEATIQPPATKKRKGKNKKSSANSAATSLKL